MKSLTFFCLSAALMASWTQPTRAQDDASQDPRVVRIVSTLKTITYIQTGFVWEVDGRVGIVTALHGVVGAKSVSAQNAILYFDELHIAMVDVDRDVAFLTDPLLLSAENRYVAESNTVGPFLVTGYPRGTPSQFVHELQPHAEALADLKTHIPPSDVSKALRKRMSPELDITVLSVRGPLQPGHSGAPLTTLDGKLVAIGSGGLVEGQADIGWAIPVTDIEWREVGVESRELTRLAREDAQALFQVVSKRRLRFGVGVSIGESNVCQDGCGGGRRSGAARVFVEWPLLGSRTVSVQTELQYAVRGTKGTRAYISEPTTGSYEYDLRYVDVNALLVLRDVVWELAFIGGLSVGFGTSGSYLVHRPVVGTSEVDVAVHNGLGIIVGLSRGLLWVGRGELEVGVRQYLGMTSVGASSQGEVYAERLSGRSYSTTVELGVRF